jgi:cell shape-determining protein MreC
MTYLQPSNRGRKTGVRKTLISLGIVIVIILGFIFTPRPFYIVMSKVFSPIWKFEFFVIGSFEHAVGIFKSKQSLVKENESLKKEIENTKPEILELKEVIQQNEQFKELLGRSEGVSRVVASILRKPPFSPYDSLVLDAGLEQKVSVGDKVYGPGQVLIGDISEVYKTTSKAELYSSPGKETPVLVGSRNVSSIAIGKGGGNFILSLPVEVGIEKGDIIKAPSIHVSILGVVEYIEVDSAESIQTVYFKSPFNINDLSLVEVFALPQ